MPACRFSPGLSRRAIRLLPALACALMGVFAIPSAAHAQCTRNPDGTFNCPTGVEPGIDAPPVINVHPGSAAVTQPTVAVTITLRDDWELIQSTFRVFRGTEDVTSQFSFGKSPDDQNPAYRMRATATGFVSLSPAGPVQLTARICDATDELRCTTSAPTVFRVFLPVVEVTPDAQFLTVASAATPKSHAFTVANRGTDSAWFALSVECRNANGDPVSGCGVPSRVQVAPGASASVNATYPASQAGQISVMVTARHEQANGVQDAGWAEIAVRTPVGTDSVAPLVVAVPLNAGATVERSQCVTVATALRGAYECGDLRVVHGLPAHRTYNRTWAPVLVYNSQHAHPTPTVYADVTLPAGAAQPTRVQVVVRMRDGAVHQASYPGSQFFPGAPQRLGVQWDGLEMSTGVYGYTLQVVSHYGTAAFPSDTLPGELTVVNRKVSPFGAGWWLAGWEQFACIDCFAANQRRLWVGGDGSTRVYTSTPGGGVWHATHPDGPPDSIVQIAGGYARPLRGGGRIEFNGLGEHVRTVNRLGQTTAFDVQGNRLFGIAVPVPSGGGAAPGWTFAYENFGSGAWRLKTVTATAPGAVARTVTLAYGGGDWRVTGITDPDGLGVGFAYPTTSFTRRIVRQRDRRGTWTYYGYDAGKLNAARTQMGASADATKDLATGFVAAETRGVAQDGGTTGASVSASAVYTRLDGPRPQTDVVDHTYLWPGRDGTLRRIRTPVGMETRIRYGDPRFPALATEVAGPSGVYTRAWYDDQGRTVTSTTFGQYLPTESSTVTYAWDAACDRPAMATSPIADTTWIEYDPVTCNPLRERLGRDTARTVTYEYYPAGSPHAGLVRAVTGPRDAEGRRAREEVEYDARGNLRLTRSPLGFLTLYEGDALGRDTAVYTPVAGGDTARDETLLRQFGARQTVVYDSLGRPKITVSRGPAIVHPTYEGNGPGTTPAESLTVATTYDAESSPRTVTRTVSPNPAGLQPQVTEYQYDAAGRRTDEWINGGIHQHFVLDQGGNVVEAVTPRQAQVISRYDAAGRLTRREVPEAFTPQTGGSCPPPMTQFEPTCHLERFPFYPNFGTGYKTPAEWTTYRYDAVGNMVWAENADAVVARTYYPNGQVRTDSTRIRDFEADNVFSRVYGIEYGYHEGRITRLIHPGNLANLAGPADVDKFAYDPRTGALSSAEDRLGNLFTFHEDAAGRLTSLVMPGGVVDSLRYDLEGRTLWRRETSPAHAPPLQYEIYVHDARDKLLRVHTPVTLDRPDSTTFVQWYSGLGNLVMTDWVNGANPQWQRERFTTDPLGNMVVRHEDRAGAEGPGNDHPDYLHLYDTGYGRVTKVSLVPPDTFANPVDDTWFRYDLSGNQETTYQRSGEGSGFTHLVDTRSFYTADERLRAYQKYDDRPAQSQSTTGGVWEEYRYDPLGRRVAVRTLRPPELCNQPAECYNSITYFVWAGDQLLWELRETDASDNGDVGGQVSYFQAGGIDRPLTIWKQGVGTVVTHQSWRGEFARGTFGVGPRAGQSSDCTEYPATNGCLPIRWPGWNTTAWQQEAAKPNTIGSERFWFGSLAVGMRDATGQLYRRNRYYDPRSGQFTQPDPIGLAGGLNVYGFAAGDPVSYSDPYGLCKRKDEICRAFVNELRALAQETGNARFDTAATILDQGNDRVVFVHPTDERLDPQGWNSDGNGATGVSGNTDNGCGFGGYQRCIFLRNDMARGDQIAIVAHEANYHARYGLSLPDARAVQDDYAFDLSIQRTLPSRYQAGTGYNRRRLIALGKRP